MKMISFDFPTWNFHWVQHVTPKIISHSHIDFNILRVCGASVCMMIMRMCVCVLYMPLFFCLLYKYV